MAWAPDYADESELRSYLRIGDTQDDPELKLAITAASRAIDHATNRQFGATTGVEQRQYETRWSPRYARYVAKIDDVMTLVGLVVTVNGSALASTAYELAPFNADLNSRPWTRIRTDSVTQADSGTGPGTILVDATFGWTAVPDTIKQACLLQASRIMNRREAPFGIAGSPDIGAGEVRLLAKVDPDVMVLLRDYRRDEPRL